MFKFFLAISLLLFIHPVFAQDDEPQITDFFSKNSGKQKWSRAVDWYNLDAPINFHNNRQKKLRLLHFFEPANPACVAVARDLEEKFEHSKAIQTIHVICPPKGIVADSSYVAQILIQHELREPVAVFTDVEPVSYLEITQFPMITLTHTGGIIQSSYAGHSGVMEGIEVYRDMASKENFGQMAIFEPTPKNIFIDNVPKRLIASPTHAVGVDQQSRLYVSDHQRNRILIVDSDGQINERIGNGNRGFIDGNIHNARFDGPSGLAYDDKNGLLYIADTYNHAIRLVELRSRQVSTILGTGSPSAILPDEVFGTTAPISSPTDVMLKNGKLYIAMTGFNQIWEMDLLTQKAKPLAGSGKRGTTDSGDEMGDAEFSGPVALEMDKDGNIVVLDRYSRNVRAVSLEGQVTTIFYNDSSEVKMKSPADILNVGSDMLISDPVAHQIFKLGPRGKLEVFNGTGSCGYADGKVKDATHGAVNGLTLFEGEIFATDALYGILRTISQKKAKMDTFEFTSIDGILAFESAVAEGEPWYFDEIKMAEGTNTINFSVAPNENYIIRSEARNEISLADGKAATRKMREDGWYGGTAVFEVDNTFSNRYIQFELYMTFSPKDKPEILYYAAVGVIIPFHEEYVSQSSHDIVLDYFGRFDRTLLP